MGCSTTSEQAVGTSAMQAILVIPKLHTPKPLFLEARACCLLGDHLRSIVEINFDLSANLNGPGLGRISNMNIMPQLELPETSAPSVQEDGAPKVAAMAVEQCMSAAA